MVTQENRKMLPENQVPRQIKIFLLGRDQHKDEINFFGEGILGATN